MAPELERPIRALCWSSVVGGALLVLSGLYTGYVEGVRSDAEGAVGAVMPAEIAAIVVGAVLVALGAVVMRAIKRAGARDADTSRARTVKTPG